MQVKHMFHFIGNVKKSGPKLTLYYITFFDFNIRDFKLNYYHVSCSLILFYISENKKKKCYDQNKWITRTRVTDDTCLLKSCIARHKVNGLFFYL